MASIDGTIVAVALPAMLREMKTSLPLVTWTITSYQLTQTITLPLAGKVTERWGRKRVFLCAVVLFSLGSIGAGLSPTIYVLIFFRVLQGAGGGMFFPAAAGVVGDVFQENRQVAIGLFVTIFQIGGVIGPNLGGVITDHLSWRWIFFVNLPIGAAILLLGLPFLPKDQKRVAGAKQSLDAAGAGLFAGGVFALLYGVTYLADHPHQTFSAVPLLFLAIGTCLLVAFVIVELRIEDPIIDLRLVGWRPFFASNAHVFMWSGAFNGFFNFVPYYAITAYGMTATESGAVLTPRSLTAVVVSVIGAVFIVRFGYRRPWLAGIYLLASSMLLAGLGLHDVSLFGLHISNFLLLATIMCLGGLGSGVAAPAAQNAAFDLVPDRIAAAAGIRAMFANSGAVMGTTAVTLVLGHFANKEHGLQFIFLGLGCVVLVSQVWVFLVPDSSRRRGKAPKNVARAATGAD